MVAQSALQLALMVVCSVIFGTAIVVSSAAMMTLGFHLSFEFADNWPTPRPAEIGRIGSPISHCGVEISVEEVTNKSDIVAIRVRLRNISQPTFRNDPLDLTALDARMRPLVAVFETPEPALPGGSLAPGATASGWITFQAAAGTSAAVLSYRPRVRCNDIRELRVALD